MGSEDEQKRREREPMYWFNKSSDMRASAGAVWYSMERKDELKIAEALNLGSGFDMKVATWPVYLMLCGLSLELMYKAVAVVLGLKPGVGHNLRSLSKTAGIIHSSQELGLLDILTESIFWYAKYPAPLPKDHAAITRLSNLSSRHLSERVPELSFKVYRSKEPHPLRWEAFTDIWLRGSSAFWKGRV